jgi:hypothetical protein
MLRVIQAKIGLLFNAEYKVGKLSKNSTVIKMQKHDLKVLGYDRSYLAFDRKRIKLRHYSNY